ncbi:MAG TPA: hypothetical protein VNJ01_17130 [Bacteriovoracaceae bacterium]|nr:hypothetical protein [Bacteriovoracaceae bacterium]
MRTLLLSLLLCTLSSAALAVVSLEEKSQKLKHLELLSSKAENMNIEAYRREFNYEQQGLSLAAKAHNEALLMVEQVRTQLVEAYSKSIREHGSHEAAVKEVTSAVENDLAMADPVIREELQVITQQTLAGLETGALSTDLQLTNLEQVLLPRVNERASYFNSESQDDEEDAKNQKAHKQDYESKKELLDVLTSEGANSPYVSGTTMSLNSSAISTSDSTIKLHVKLEFKGVYIDAGPSVTFTREWSSHVSILAEGLDPILDEKGYFNFTARKNGKKVRRHMLFSCQTGLFFQTKTAISVGVGAGGSTSFLAPVSLSGSVSAEQANSNKYKNSVNLTSKRVLLPGHIGSTPVTLEILNKICHHDFLNARINDQMTVKGSLDIMMKNVVASLRFRNPKTKCVIDNQCFDWYNKLGLVRVNNYPRCILDEKNGEYAYCALKGLKGQACTVYENGKRVSTDMFEYPCDSGLTCFKVREAGWLLEGLTGRLWSAPKGQCH